MEKYLVVTMIVNAITIVMTIDLIYEWLDKQSVFVRALVVLFISVSLTAFWLTLLTLKFS